MIKRTFTDITRDPRQRSVRFLVFSQIAAQLGLAIIPFNIHSAHAESQPPKWYQSGNLTQEEQRVYQLQTQRMGTAATILAQDDSTTAASAMARSAAAGALNNEVVNWLNKFGSARVQLNLDENYTLSGSQADMLVPLYENDSTLLFSQFGLRRVDQRTTANLGLGARTYTGDWMLGVNTFLDNDFSGNNRRLGLGVEAWRDYLKLSGNSYFRLNNWHQSRDFADYDERPANGWDIRAEGWLPSWPQLGAKVMYERYQGNEVALFGKDNRQQNPWAFTGGVNYTPFPLITVGAEHRAGKNGQQDSQINLALNYRMGEPWHKQIDPSAVGATRLLSGNRYDLVERNNSIVLDYRKQALLTLGLPEKVSGKSRSVIPVSFVVKNTHPIQRINWESAALSAAGGIITPAGEGRLSITLPAWQITGNNSYILSGTVYDVEGNNHHATTTLTVEMADINVDSSSVSATPTAIPANGISTSRVTVTLLDKDAKPVTDMAPALKMALTQPLQQPQSATQNATIGEVKETAAGVYAAVLTAGTHTGSVVVTPSINGITLKAITIQLTADNASGIVADGALVVTTDNSLSNGSAANQVSATVTDASGNPVTASPVTFTLSGSAVATGSLTQQSDASGVAKLSFTNEVAEAVTITAAITHNGDTGASVVTHFIADRNSASLSSGDLTVDHAYITANGTDKATFTVLVKDAKGNPVPDIAVSWSSSGGSISASSSSTNQQGKATITLSHTVTGTVQVTATVNNTAVTKAVEFTADNQHAGIDSRDLSRDKETEIADGARLISFTAIVKDRSGNLVPGITVKWNTDKGTLNARSSVTGSDGKATTQLSSTQAGDAQVTAQIGSAEQVNAPMVNFVGDSGSATLKQGNVTRDRETATANGTDKITYSALVLDANNNRVPGVTVDWKTDVGSLGVNGSDASSTTGVDGIAKIELTSIRAAEALVSAAVNSGTAVNADHVTFMPDYLTGTIVNLISVKEKISGTGVETTQLTATMLDANNNPLKGVKINWHTNTGSMLTASSVTDASGQAISTLQAPVLVAARNGTATVSAEAEYNARTHSHPVDIRAVLQTNGKYYWTMIQDHFTQDRNQAASYCQNYGGGRLLTRSDVADFGATGADFASMSVNGEFRDAWYLLDGEWMNVTADLNSLGLAEDFGAIRNIIQVQSPYVCVKSV